MVTGRNRDSSRLYKRKIQQDGESGAASPVPTVAEPTANALGRWTRHGFEFASPEAKDQWHREAYRQAVHHEKWHLGDPVDYETLQIIEAGAAGKSPPTFIGPDRQPRFSNFQTIEPVEVRAIRARNFADKRLEEVSAPKMPGEAEAAHYMNGHKGRSRSAARPPRDEYAADSAATQPSNQADPILVAASSPLPLMPEGLGPAAPIAPKPMGGIEPLKVGGKIPAGGPSDFAPRPANDNFKPTTESPVSPRPESQSTLNQTAPAGSASTPPLSTQSPLMVRKNDIEAAIQNTINDRHRRWAQDLMSDPRSSDPTFVADRATQAMIFDLPFAIESFRTQPGRDILQSPTPLDIELLRGAYNQKIIDLFPKQSRPALQKAMDARPKILTSGPAGLSDVLAAMQQGTVTGLEVNGQSATMGPNPFGSAGAPPIVKFNEIVGEEATKLLESCEGVEGEVVHTAGKGSVRSTESWIQKIDRLSTNLGSRRIDVTVHFTINGQPCTFQINTADTAGANLFTEREWQAIESAAKMNRENTADMKAFNTLFEQRIAAKVLSQFSAFFMIGKPKKGQRSDEEMRKLAQDTLGLISCSQIELACKGNLVINQRPRR